MRESRKRAIKNYRKRQDERGLVQVHPYVPKQFRGKLLEFARDLRELADVQRVQDK